jgi:DNA repair exonuclease SbcCD ATPase subunit
VHELLNERREAFSEALEDLQRLSELEAEVRELRYLLGRADARGELRAQAESNLREALERERERADRLEEELKESRKASPEPAGVPQTASEETARYKATPEQEETLQRRSWWRAFFGME